MTRMAQQQARGYFGVAVYHPKTEENVGTLWRTASLYDADFLCTIGRRYRRQVSDTMQTPRHTPLFHYDSLEDFYAHLPQGCRLVCVECGGSDLPTFTHPQQAVYLLGAEDYGLPATILEKQLVVAIPTAKSASMNVAVAGSIVLYDRYSKEVLHA